MRHEITALNTKRMLADSLKKIMEKKPFSKITVTEIITDCGVNRKTFYYHFSDTYALLHWFLEQETTEVLKAFDLLVHYEDAVLFIMDYTEKNAHILNCALDSAGRELLQSFLYTDFVSILKTVIESIEEELRIAADPAFKDDLCKFYADGVAGMLLRWIQNESGDPNKNDRTRTVRFISAIFRDTLPELLKNNAAQNEI